MKICLFDSDTQYNNFGFSASYDESDRSLIRLLEDNNVFSKKIISLRSKYKIPYDGLAFKSIDWTAYSINLRNARFYVIWQDYCEKHIKDNTSLNVNEIFKDTFHLLNSFHLHERWFMTFYFYIFFNIMPSPLSPPMSVFTGRELYEAATLSNNTVDPFAFEMDSAYIVLRGKFSKTIFHQIIDKYFGLIDTKVIAESFFHKSTTADLDIHQTIYRLSLKGIKSPQIARELHKKYGISLSDVDVRNKLSYYKRYILPRLKVS